MQPFWRPSQSRKLRNRMGDFVIQKRHNDLSTEIYAEIRNEFNEIKLKKSLTKLISFNSLESSRGFSLNLKMKVLYEIRV